MARHFLSAADLSREETEALLERAQRLKAEWRAGAHGGLPLQGKTLALVFEKPSLRTRVAFEAGMTQLGGHASYLSANDIDMGGRESVPDVARNLSRWVQVIAARVFKHATVEDLARYASVPVINALSDREHPCQALADMLTLRERFGRLQGLRLAYVGDGNNVSHSLLLMGATLGVNVSELLGGRVRDRVKVCYPIFRSRNMEEVSVNLQAVDAKFAEGFDVFRLYAGVNPDADEAFLSAVREKYGNRITIKSLDFSHLLDWKKALQVTRRLMQYNVLLVESPAPRNDFEGLRNFRMSVDLPVSEHVWSFRQLHEMILHDAVDVFNIALVFIGGFAAARKAAAAAEVAGKGCLIGTTQELSIGTAAQAIFGASLTNLTEISDITGPRLYTDDVAVNPVAYQDGYVLLPDRSKPGLGIDVDWDKVERLKTAGFSWGDQKLHQLQDRTTF